MSRGRKEAKEWSSKPSASLKPPYLKNGLIRKGYLNQSWNSHLDP